MKRVLKRLVAAGMLLLLLVVAGGGWLLYSNSGAVWLLGQLDGLSGVRLQAESLQGRLADQLNLRGLEIDWGAGRLEFASLVLVWSPWSMLEGRLEVERLEVSGLDLWVDEDAGVSTVTEVPPESADQLLLPAAWPVPSWLQAEVGTLQLLHFNYQTAESRTVIADRIEGHLQLEGKMLQLTPAVYLSPYVELRGKLRWDLYDMQLDYQTEVVLPDDLVSGDSLASAGLPAAVTGQLQVQGDWRAYRGRLQLKNGPTRLAGEVFGTLDGVWFRDLSGDWLQGQLQRGRLDLDWRTDFRMDWQAELKHINPAETALARRGDLSFASRGSLQVPEADPVLIEGRIDKLQGQLEGYPLTGRGEIVWAGDALVMRDLNLQSQGTLLTADGSLADRLNLQLQVEDLSRWNDQAAGQFRADGWLKHAAGEWTGAGVATGQQLRWQEWQVGTMQLQGDHPQAGSELHLHLGASELVLGELQFTSLDALLDGWPSGHQLKLQLEGDDGNVQLAAAGKWEQEEWRGTLERLSTRVLQGGGLSLQRPTGLRWSKKAWALAPLLLSGAKGESLRLAGHYRADHRDGDISGSWDNLQLERLSPLLPEQVLRGESSGSFSLQMQGGLPTRLVLEVDAAGELRHRSWAETLESLHLNLDWSQQNMVLSGRAAGSTGATLQVEGKARQPLGLQVPDEGHLRLTAAGVQLAHLKPWLPAGLQLKGLVDLDGEGDWLGGGNFQFSGEAQSRDGQLGWQDSRGVLHSSVETATLGIQWREQHLDLQTQLVLGAQGTLKGEAHLPIAARWPLVFDPQRPLSGGVQGQLGETGLLESLLTLPIEELSGKLDVDLAVAGSLQHPDLQGTLQLAEAGAFLPQLGVSLRPVELDLRLSGDRLEIERMRVFSAESALTGKGYLQFGNAAPVNFHLELTGNNFKAIDLPELAVDLSPQLELNGTMDRFSLRGRLLIPRLELRGVRAAPAVPASPEVVVVTRQKPATDDSGWIPDVKVRVVLGDKVHLKTEGLSARLEGEAEVSLATSGAPQADGEIRVAEGDYAAYGVKLKIRRGLLRYRGVPLTNPSLDILAIRDLGQLQAGVQISGTAQRPRVILYSRPAMPEKDVLLAIITGRRPVSGEDSEGMLMLGGGALLAPGESVFSKIGLTNIDLQGLFAGEGGLRLRHRFAERWEVESVLGINSGVDLFYVVEFQ